MMFKYLLLGLIFLNSLGHLWASESFENFEIRVIRPQFFTKTMRLELGVENVTVMNQTYYYTTFLSGFAGFHFNDIIGLEFSGGVGNSIDKDIKSDLSDQRVDLSMIKPEKFYLGSVNISPMYGKYLMPSGKLVYFDTVLTFGGGVSGVDYTYESCLRNNPDRSAIREDGTEYYNTYLLGLGQRFYLNKNTSIRWDLKSHITSININDKECIDSGEENMSIKINAVLQFGFSFFI